MLDFVIGMYRKRKTTSIPHNRVVRLSSFLPQISYNTIQYTAHVLDSWELIRRIPSYDNKCGTLLFEK